MHKKLLFSLFCFLVIPILTNAQSTAFTLSGGSTIGTQRWDNSFDRQPLFQWHATIAAESVNNEDDKASIYAQLGYHVKGSAIRFQFFNSGGTGYFQTVDRFKFNNISLILGAKQKFPLGSGKSKYFYFGGIRGDYTVSTNLGALAERNAGFGNQYAALIYPFPEFVRRVTGGVSAGAGIQLPLSDLIGAELKLSIHPDFTLQYNQPPIPNVIINDPFNPGQTTNISARRIRNVALELSLGFRFLRKVVYEEN
jgi:hypothetical protein